MQNDRQGWWSQCMLCASFNGGILFRITQGMSAPEKLLRQDQQIPTTSDDGASSFCGIRHNLPK